MAWGSPNDSHARQKEIRKKAGCWAIRALRGERNTTAFDFASKKENESRILNRGCAL